MLTLTLSAQEVMVMRNDSVIGGKFGLYNERTREWVTNAEFDGAWRLGHYSGLHYYTVQKNALYAVIDEKGRMASAFQWESIGDFENGFFVVKRDGSWGLADVYGHLIVDCEYQRSNLGPQRVVFFPWSGKYEEQLVIRMDELVKKRDALIREEQEAAENAARAEQERLSREKKEKELASFTEYARNYVEPRVNAWQHKGEFEKMADYQLRVTGPNRTAMIDSLTRVAERNFIAEHAALKPENAPMTLDLYDSENEVFFIESEKLGKMVVPVPIREGPDFKAHFASLERKNAVFSVEDDGIVLAVLDFYDAATGKTYHFRNDNALSYNHYEVDPDSYHFDLVSVVTAKPAEAPVSGQAQMPRRPVITILSPEKNSAYSEPEVTIRYQASVFDGSRPTLHVWVNGVETAAVPVDRAGQKGVAAAWDEVELVLPKDREHPCNIMLAVTDGSGYSSENKTISLKYAGDVPKPSLHLFAVGVSDYASPSLPKLGYAAKDAADFVQTIRSSDVSMYDRIVSPVILTDASATRANIERGLADLTRQVGQDDVVMLFFSGHGVLDGEDAYFMSVDADGADPYTGVDFSLIRKNMAKMKDKKCRVLIFMDACYSGAMFNTKSNLKSITFAEHDIIGFYSSTASQTSAEFSADENGLFTKALIEGLKGKAQNGEGEITTIGLQQFISDYVNRQTKGRQSPIVENKLGDIILYKVK